MKTRRRFAIVAVTAVAAAGGGAAIAATEDDRGKKAEEAVLSDAADRLDVEPGELRSALSEAQQAQIDKAVDDGVLTEEDAEHIKERLEDSGLVLGFPGGPPPGGPHGLHGPGPGGPAVFDAIAEELGISVERLHDQLVRGKSMAQVARANGKSLTDVKDAARAAIEKQIDEDVAADRITEEQADELREHLPQMLQHLVRGPCFDRARTHALPLPPPPGVGPPPMMREFRR